MQRIVVNISIGPEEWIKLYQGLAQDVTARAQDGRSVRFPARILSRFYLNNGIRGSFCISFNDQGKFESIERV